MKTEATRLESCQTMAMALLALFFLSGACSLVYQLIWARMLVVAFGVSTYAVSTVLTAFMAGLALGSLLFGRIVDRYGKSLLIYGLLEFGIGLFALILPVLFSGFDSIYTTLSQRTDSGTIIGLSRFGLTFFALLIPTTMMGATLPVLSKFVSGSVHGAGSGIGKLYGINTIGAAAGCMITAFIFLPNMGTLGATYVAVVGNWIVGCVALYLHKVTTRDVVAEVSVQSERANEDGSDHTLPRWISPAVLVCIGLSGFAALGYEVVWTRILNILNRTTTTQGLSVILIAFLVGISVGSWVGSKLSTRIRDSVFVFGVVEVLIGLFGFASIALIGGVPLYFTVLGDLFDISWQAELFVAAFVVTIIPTGLMGVTFPIVARIQIRRMDSIGRSVGDVYAANTIGAIIGACISGFVLIPLAGTQQTVEFLAWCNIAVGLVLISVSPLASVRVRMRALAGGGLVVAAVYFTIPGNLFVQLLEGLESDGQLLHYTEDVAGTVTVHETPGGNRALRVNGTGEVRDDFASIQTFRMLGNLPPLLHPDPNDVVVVAFGGGVTLSSVEIHQPERLSCVEIVPGVFRAARYFGKYNNHLSDRFGAPHLRLFAEDGRNYLLRTAARYDIIICDSTHPTTADSWLLYTREFYDICRQRLKQGGMMAQWVPTHGLSAEEYRTIVRTFFHVFPHSSIWLNQIYTILLATPESLEVDFNALTARMSPPAIQANLKKVELAEPLAFLSMLGLGETAIQEYVGAGEINTDARTYAGYLRDNESGLDGSAVIESLHPYLVKKSQGWLTADEQYSMQVERRLTSRERSLSGLIHMMRGKNQQARNQFNAALRNDSEEVMAKRLLKILNAKEVVR